MFLINNRVMKLNSVNIIFSDITTFQCDAIVHAGTKVRELM